MGLMEKDGEHQASTSSSVESGQIGKHLPRKIKILTAIAIFYSNAAFGCAYNTYGPVITSMQNKYETDDATISRVFTILTGGYLVGALLGGIIFNYMNRQLAVIILLLTQAGVLFLTPHCPTMALFFVTAGIMGVSCGAYDTAQFAWMMEMMQKECPPYVMGQHFTYAIGTNLAALIMAPFLDEGEEKSVTSSTITSTTLAYNSFLQNSSNNGSWPLDISTTKKPEGGSEQDKLFIPYIIVGLFVATAVAFQVFLFIFFRYFAPPPEVYEGNENKELENSTPTEKSTIALQTDNAKPCIGQWSWPKIRMVIMSCCFYGAYQGMEMCTFQFFSKFAQNSDLDLSESDAAFVLTGMTAAFAVGRGAAIIVVFKISTQLIVAGNIIICAIANILLIGWAVRSLPVLWASSILFGLGFSSVYPSFSAFMERYLIFTNFVTSLMLICGSAVAAIYPLVIGNFIEKSPIVLSYTSFFSIALLVFSFSTISILTRKNKTRY